MIPRSEHPEPMFYRESWENLNGEWDFEFDFGKSGRDRKFYKDGKFTKKITVPFCPESKLSGIEYKDFIPCVWYKRTFTVKEKNKRVILHFGAVDYKSYIYINCEEVFTHKGGYSSFSVDITKYIKDGENEIVLCAEDDTRSGMQAKGKQANYFYSNACDYTRTTGIWQTVWLEYVPESYIKRVQFYPDAKNQKVTIKGVFKGQGEFCAEVFYKDKKVGESKVFVEDETAFTEIALSEKHLWEVGNGRLYDVFLTFGEDKVKSYFGLRDIHFDGMKFILNGKSVFQRLVLDQGFFPDGIYTAKDDEELKRDITLSKNAGFNGARLHQKIFEPRYLYYCDKEGYLVWGEHGNWGLDYSDYAILPDFLNEWQEAVLRDFNHPSIIGWCPFNETWDFREQARQKNSILETVYKVTKALDTTRPCIDTSGNFHTITDIFDVHDYEQDTKIFKENYDKLMTEGKLIDRFEYRQKYRGEPTFVSEYGGMKWDLDRVSEGWGYGNAPKTEEEFINRYKGLTDALLDNDKMFAFCYTQLYDVEQEINGLYTYDRRPKFDMYIIKKINERKAKIEE